MSFLLALPEDQRTIRQYVWIKTEIENRLHKLCVSFWKEPQIDARTLTTGWTWTALVLDGRGARANPATECVATATALPKGQQIRIEMNFSGLPLAILKGMPLIH
jgi:hypothetical protein